ncbi:hypothetical protein HNY73_005579 [Argiope bruennichi]|uniref:Sushi domain-containing protein n=1 Tax=Argiope bruennichi TaxID=94029 RepID=A0A8T0FJL5_ARGBR|nr:hypothetical protein HNY73_005579 [Argiope bruennichi]
MAIIENASLQSESLSIDLNREASKTSGILILGTKWLASANLLISDDSMTTLGIASSTPTVPGHSADLAIDRDKNTCSYLKPKKPRWWRVDLKGKHKVLSVAVTVISPAILCDNLDDLEQGNVRITYDSDSPPMKEAVAIYKCNEGYKLEGPFKRNCLKDGSWSGEDPQCRDKDEPAVIQVEVLDNEDSGKKVEPLSSVPEQNEDTSPENVVLDIEDKSNKDSTPKEPRSAVTFHGQQIMQFSASKEQIQCKCDQRPYSTVFLTAFHGKHIMQSSVFKKEGIQHKHDPFS